MLSLDFPKELGESQGFYIHLFVYFFVTLQDFMISPVEIIDVQRFTLSNLE